MDPTQILIVAIIYGLYFGLAGVWVWRFATSRGGRKPWIGTAFCLVVPTFGGWLGALIWWFHVGRKL